MGRPIPFALAVEGEKGVKNVLQMLREEFELAMSLAGCTKISDIKRGLVETDKDRIRLAITGSTGGIRTPVPRL